MTPSAELNCWPIPFYSHARSIAGPTWSIGACCDDTTSPPRPDNSKSLRYRLKPILPVPPHSDRGNLQIRPSDASAPFIRLLECVCLYVST
ncbi:unnamed protein product [Protopolystoma xenopodis]|uniref:Uncharacterized protein n=1 Tax=Protopolystoma xenopodis TaxID=117903 RepID=A0A3S5FEN6_9PLAT|nr:unnamed protein product [Protopolystoma xenopodis]